MNLKPIDLKVANKKEASISLNKSGLITINVAAMQKLELKKGSFFDIIQDQDSLGDFYIKTGSGRFEPRIKNGSGAVSSAAAVNLIKEATRNSEVSTLRAKLGEKQELHEDERVFFIWPLLIKTGSDISRPK